MSIVVSKQKTIFIGDVNPSKTINVANIAIGEKCKEIRLYSKVAILSYSNFDLDQTLKN